MTLSILITNYNTWELTLRAVESVMRYCTGTVSPEIIVVDDASDDSPDVIATLMTIPNLQIRFNRDNIGYVRSVNLGVSLCRTDLVLLLDSDTYLLNVYQKRIVETFAANPSLGAIGLTLVDEHGELTGNAEAEPTVWTLLMGQKLHGLLNGQRTINNLVLYSCGMAFRRAAFIAVGGFDEQFDFLDADLDFSMTLRRKGWVLAITKEIRAYHVGGGSPQLTSERVVRFYANRYSLLRKHRKIKCPSVIHMILLMRILAEYVFLQIASTWLYDDSTVRRDKIEGRRRLLNLLYNQFM